MPEVHVDRRLAAIFAGDIIGFSRLMEVDEEGTHRRVKELRKELVDPKIGQNRGRLVKTTGDGMLVEFASVVDAVRCAVDIQRDMVARNLDVPDEKRIQFRIGINLGDIIIDGDDIYGDGINIAARLESIAEPGSICISEDAYRQVNGKLSVKFRDGGEQRLYNMTRPLRVYHLLLDGTECSYQIGDAEPRRAERITVRRSYFVSYHSSDHVLAERLKASIEQKEPKTRLLFAPAKQRSGGVWSRHLRELIAEADAFILLLGDTLEAWQKLEYYEALDRRAHEPEFGIVPVVTVSTAPGLPFLHQLRWISTPTPHAEPSLTTITRALRGDIISDPEKPWLMVNPYRGLLSLREEDSGYFFGREHETAEILKSIEQQPSKIITLIGNSGVGKSSLIQAGVIGALKRERWPGAEDVAAAIDAWPAGLRESRSWAYLSMRPGENPIRALISAFTDLWFEERGDPRRHDWIDGWEARLNGKGRLVELLDDTQARYIDIKSEAPSRIVLYLDQAEELYASRTPQRLAGRFSEIVAEALGDPRLLVLASQRSDYYGHLQANSALFRSTKRIDVLPLSADGLRIVLTAPTQSLGASFESDELVTLLVDASKNQAGALPLLADHMSELWSRMQMREDGVIRVAERSEIIRISSALVNRANRFLAEHAEDLETIKRLFCLQLAHVPREGEPVRRRASKSNCTDIEWRLIEDMSGAQWRLLVTGEIDGIAQAEIAHEVLLREWPTLRQWLSHQREFLAWRGEIEHARREAELISKSRRRAALLMGRSLELAENWLAVRSKDIGHAERVYIQESLRNRRQQRRALRLILALAMISVIVQPLGILYLSQFRAGLIDARIRSLLVQGEIVAGAVAASATAETDTITIDPERLLELQAGESYHPPDDALSRVRFPINPERVAPLLRRLVSPTNTRARVYDKIGGLILDSRNLYDVLRFDLPPPMSKPSFIERAYVVMRSWLSRDTLPLYRELGPQNGTDYGEVSNALQGFKSSMVRINEGGELIVSVAVPVQRFRMVHGALMLSTQGGDIDKLVASERLNQIKTFTFSLVAGLMTAWLAFRSMRGVLRLSKR